MNRALLALTVLLFAFPPLSFASQKINKASYWIDRLKSPDRVILTPEEIEGLNGIIFAQNGQMADLDTFPGVVPGASLREWLLHDPLPLRGAKRFNSRGKKLKDEFFDGLFEDMNLDGVNEENEVRLCVLFERADVKAFPTDEPVLISPGKKGFDAFQYMSIYPPERAALLHLSRDGRWGFFQTPILRGWIRLDKVAFVDESREGEAAQDFLVVTGSKVKIFGDSLFKGVLGTVPMGARLYLKKASGPKVPYVVRFPKDDNGALKWTDGYIKKGADVSEGFLPYTRRNVIAQAFKMLGEEYGWGGKDGKRDCSEFIKDLFASMGIKLPRNSSDQRAIGDVRADWYYPEEEIEGALSNAEPGITLIGFKGHVMLYIGERDKRPYVIHQVYGYADRKFKVINRVAVTDLNLGRRSKAGPLKKRIKSINEILIPPAYGVISSPEAGVRPDASGI